MNRIAAATIAAIALLLPAGTPVLAASCNGASHHIQLSGGRASPGSGPPGTLVTFSVTYADSAGCAPSSVTVQVPGVGTFALGGSGSNYQSGVGYSVSVKLPGGTHRYSFSATSGTGNGVKTAVLTAVSPASVVISSPTPIPTPRPTPAPTPPPPPPRTEAPLPPPPPTAVPPTALPPGASPTPRQSSNAPWAPSGTAAAAPTGAAESPSDDPSEPPPTVVGGLAPPPDGATTPGGASSKLGGGFSFSFGIPLPIIAYLASTAAGIGFFMLLVRRRRPDSDTALVPAIASPAAPPPREPDAPNTPHYLAAADDDDGPDPSEAGVPRWLRSSLRDARRGPDSGRMSGRG